MAECAEPQQGRSAAPDGAALAAGAYRGPSLFGVGEPNETALQTFGAGLSDVYLARLAP